MLLNKIYIIISKFIIRKKYFFICIIFFIGFLIRIYASLSIPLTKNEFDKIEFLKNINLNINNLNLPLGSKIIRNPPLLPYLIKFSYLIFGENLIAFRLPSVLFGTVLLIFFYFLVEKFVNPLAAIISLIFATFSQFFIGASRIAWEDGLILFFTFVVIYFAQKAFQENETKNFILAGVAIGAGLLVKETFLTILPSICFYLFVFKNKTRKINVKNIFLFFLFIFLLLIPDILWNFKNEFSNYKAYLTVEWEFGFSLIPLALFLGEIFVYALSSFNDSFFQLAFSYEYPFLHWIIGLICITAAVYYLKSKKSDFIYLLLLIFWSIFVMFLIVRAKSGGGYYFHFDNFWWATVAVVPGVILGSAMLSKFLNKYKFFKVFLLLIIIYLIFNAVSFVSFPANCFIPRDSIKIYELRKTAKMYLEDGNKENAFKIYNYLDIYYERDKRDDKYFLF